jgi:hypothetical protein
LEPVRIAYLEPPPDNSATTTTNNRIQKQVKGTAIKRLEGSWKVFLNDGRELAKTKAELVDAECFYVAYAFENMTKEQKRRQKQKERSDTGQKNKCNLKKSLESLPRRKGSNTTKRN